MGKKKRPVKSRFRSCLEKLGYQTIAAVGLVLLLGWWNRLGSKHLMYQYDGPIIGMLGSNLSSRIRRRLFGQPTTDDERR